MKRISIFSILLIALFSNYLLAQQPKTDMRNISSMQIVAEMGAGWNLGNTLDATTPTETGWGNPYTTKVMIDEIAKRGFKTLRVPVSWGRYMGNAPNYTVQKAWLDRVEEIVNYGLDNNMYVIVNIHHDNSWIIPTYSNVDQVKKRLDKLWTQIAIRFKDYDDHLIFENLNEPRHEGSAAEWTGGTAEGRDCVNQYHKACLEAVRATGGNNSTRQIMISTYAAGGSKVAMDALEIPNNDPNTIVSIHTYFPFGFCLNESDKTWGTEADKKALDEELDNIYNKFVAKGIAVVLGEWGSTNQNNQADRNRHAEYYAKASAERGMPLVYWDNGDFGGFAIFNRRTLTWHFPEMADAIVRSANITVKSGNPIIKHIRSADPSAEVWNDGQVWIYASHDHDDATDYSTMDNYHAYSSYDLVNWKDHGEIFHANDVSWVNPDRGFMFAPDAAYKDGTYYLYFPTMSNEWQWRVGVATSDKPEGPFTDIGNYIDGTDHIDPTCFVDDDGQAYLVWGGDAQNPKIAKLKENMIELAEEPRVIEYGADNFGEGPYMHKKDGKYYFSYTCNTCYPYQGFYAMSDTPYGPFEYKGILNKTPPGAQDHHSIIEYHGQSYYFYHVGNYADGSLHRRNICIDSLNYNADGTMQEVIQTKYGVALDTIGATTGLMVPGRIQSENYFRSSGINTEVINEATTIISKISDGDWFDFVLEILGSEEYQTDIKISDAVIGSTVYLLVDEKMVDTLTIDSESELLTTSVFLHKGKHTFKLLFENAENNNDLLNVDWIDLQGERNYFTVTTSTSEGGTINPLGKFYVAQGDSLKISLESYENYILDSLFIDGIYQSPADFYTINVEKDHTVNAKYTICTAVELIPYYKVNDSIFVNSSEATLTEGNQLTLKVELDEGDLCNWETPTGETSVGNELIINDIRATQAGIYRAFFVNNLGCVSEITFSVSVNYIHLDVFEAEDWYYMSGIRNQNCNDIGGGEYLTLIQNNDFTFYNIDIEESGLYAIIARVATELNGGRIEISNDKGILAVIPVSGELSNGWNEWYTTSPIELELEQGLQRLRFTFKGESGDLFNFNWFDLELIRPTSTTSLSESYRKFSCFPTPNNNGYTINYQLEKASKVSCIVYNVSGNQVKTIESSKSQNAGRYEIYWNGISDESKQVPNGIYLVVFKTNDWRETRKIVFIE